MIKLRWLETKSIASPTDIKVYRESCGCGVMEARSILENRQVTLQIINDINIWVDIPTESVIRN